MGLTAARPRAPYLSDQRFFTGMAQALAALIIFGFLQWTLRGFVDPLRAPIWIHLHGLAMLGWLGLLVTQSRLAGADNLVLHRRLGWIGMAMVALIVALGITVGRLALAQKRVPPFFSDAWFLALTHTEVIVFASMVAAAVAKRGDTQWHRRLMLGATVVLMEPALGRMLPMPLLGQAAGGWVEAAVQIGFLGYVARHDVRCIGRIHPATLASMVVVLAVHALIQTFATMPAVAIIAETIAHGSGAA